VREPLPTDIRELAAAQAEVMSDLVAGLSDADLVSPTRCAGWLATHLLVHVRLGLAEATGSFAEPTDEPADRDYVSYWRNRPAGSACKGTSWRPRISSPCGRWSWWSISST